MPQQLIFSEVENCCFYNNNCGSGKLFCFTLGTLTLIDCSIDSLSFSGSTSSFITNEIGTSNFINYLTFITSGDLCVASYDWIPLKTPNETPQQTPNETPQKTPNETRQINRNRNLNIGKMFEKLIL